MPKKRKKRKKLAHNPKLTGNDKKRKKELKKGRAEPDYYEYKRSYTKYYMLAIFVGLIIVILIIYSTVYNTPGPRVEQYDGVKLNYEIYTLDQYNNQEDPTIKKTNEWINACVTNQDDNCDNGIFEGFYDKLIGKKEGDVCNYEPIEDCECKQYEALDGEDIILWFKVLEINKSMTTTNTEASFNSNKIISSHITLSTGQIFTLFFYIPNQKETKIQRPNSLQI